MQSISHIAPLYSNKRGSKDYRTRRDRTETLTRQFDAQLEAMTDAYIQFQHQVQPTDSDPLLSSSSGRAYTVRVVDIFGELCASTF